MCIYYLDHVEDDLVAFGGILEDVEQLVLVGLGRRDGRALRSLSVRHNPLEVLSFCTTQLIIPFISHIFDHLSCH